MGRNPQKKFLLQEHHLPGLDKLSRLDLEWVLVKNISEVKVRFYFLCLSMSFLMAKAPPAAASSPSPPMGA